MLPAPTAMSAELTATRLASRSSVMSTRLGAPVVPDVCRMAAVAVESA